LAAAALIPGREALAQAAFPPPPPKVSPAAGVVDMHVHSHPDVFGRNLDDIDVAQIARSRGMKGIVLKNHVAETAGRAKLVMKVVPGIEVFGGIVLNKAVGGINPDAVEWMHRTFGGRGKMVWLPTFESDKHVKTFGKPDAVGLVVAPKGQVTPEMEAILKIIARENLVLGTGHVHPEEIVAVVKRARELGVKSILINHALTNVPGLTMAQAKQVTGMGAMIEVCFLQFQAGPNAPLPFLKHWTQINAKHVAQAVKEMGAGAVLISSDLGQTGNMVHPDGLEAAVAAMKQEGISDADIDTMMRKNPAKLLGLSS
jgi:microsomal dipeptidase-like Zn-dependent dipeptidase